MKLLPLLLLIAGCAVQPVGRDGLFSPVFVEEYWLCSTGEGDELVEDVTICAVGTGPPPEYEGWECGIVSDDTTGRRPRNCGG